MPDNNKYGIALSAPKYFPTRMQESAVIRLVILSNQAFQTPSMLFSRFPRDGLEFLAVGQTCIATPLQIQLLAIKITLKEASLPLDNCSRLSRRNRFQISNCNQDGL